MGGAQTGVRSTPGFGPQECAAQGRGMALGKPAGGGDSPVPEARAQACGIQSTPRHVEPWRNARGPPRKAEYYLVTDRAEYCEGKVKSTPGGE